MDVFCGFSVVSYLPLDIIKLVCQYIQTGHAWNLMMEQRVFFTRKKNYGQQARQAQWATISTQKKTVDKDAKGKIAMAKNFIQGIAKSPPPSSIVLVLYY